MRTPQQTGIFCPPLKGAVAERPGDVLFGKQPGRHPPPLRGTPETRTYDSWGRLATRAQGTYSATYGYRYGGRLYNFTSNFPGEAAATLEYRGDGRLHRRTVGTDIKVYRYDAGWNAINTEDNAGGLLAASVYEPGQEVGQRLAYSYGSLGIGTVVYAYHDQLGSTRRWRLNKSNWGANEYEPYGEAYAVSTLAPRDYALHEWDPAIAAYRAPYRNYSPTMARWMTRDPLGMVDGPNMYGYVGGRTINSLDMMGLKNHDVCEKEFDECAATCKEPQGGPLHDPAGWARFWACIGKCTAMKKACNLVEDIFDACEYASDNPIECAVGTLVVIGGVVFVVTLVVGSGGTATCALVPLVV
ncbi:MAG: hypothetical protein H3C30_14770 [Candidatus Hydrogenedentes bacterium]|nr:hypothetical protein [Candidatus Hydrogenedentota bacterium]